MSQIEKIKTEIQESMNEIKNKVPSFDCSNMTDIISQYSKPITIQPNTLHVILDILFKAFEDRIYLSPTFQKVAIEKKVKFNFGMEEDFVDNILTFNKDEALLMLNLVIQCGMRPKHIPNWCSQFRTLLGDIAPKLCLQKFLELEFYLDKPIKLVTDSEENLFDRRSIYPDDKVYQNENEDLFVIFDSDDSYQNKQEVVIEKGIVSIFTLLQAFIQLRAVGPTFIEVFEGIFTHEHVDNFDVFHLSFGCNGH
jgi:hypothetical protein